MPAPTVQPEPWTPLIEPVSLDGGYFVRELPPEEWARVVLEDGRVFADIAQPGANVHIVVLEAADGHILAQCPVFAVAHADGLYSDGTLTDHPKASLAFVGAIVVLLQRAGITALYAVAASPSSSADILERMGFDLVQERLFHAQVPVPPAEDR